VEDGVTRRFGPVGGSGLIEDVADVGADGPDSDDQLFGDLTVGPARGDKTNNFDLSLRETVLGYRAEGVGRLPEGICS